jgi:integrase
VGRRRKDDKQGLPNRVYLRRGNFFYVHRDTGKWENLGRDLTAARKRAEHFNDPAGSYGTMKWFLDAFIEDGRQRVAAGTFSQRTLDDYIGALVPLKAFFGSMLPNEVAPMHVMEYLDIGAKSGRGVRANRERACLSACMSWMLRCGHGGIQVNPCMRSSGVRRNPERQRERYVTDEEYLAVYEAAGPAVRLMMELVFRTLQRPEVDVLAWTPENIRTKGDGRVLHFRQSKTGRLIDIALVGRLAQLIDEAIGPVPVLRQPIVHNGAGDAYTYGGISAMLKKAQERVRVANGKQPSKGSTLKTSDGPLKSMSSFGFRDLKGKGATDMWLAGEPIERIQLLCGHARKTTTEVYIKARWTETASPNALTVGRR